MIPKTPFGALAALSFATSALASGPAICDPQQSTLCVGLKTVYAFEEAQGAPRYDENRGSAWLEADGQDIARAAGKVDSYAVSFSGTSGNYLYIPRAGAALNGSTVAFWIYPTSAATEQIVISADEPTKHGPYLSLVPSAGAVKVKATAYYGDGRATVAVTSTNTLSLNAWHLVVWGYDAAEAADFATTSQTGQIMFVSLDGAARDTVGLAYFPIAGPFNDLILGQRNGTSSGYTLPFSGRIDQLTFAGRTWDSVAITEFYNLGSGKAYPFAPTSYAGLNSGLVAYWKLDETATGTRQDSAGTNHLTDTLNNVAAGAGRIGSSTYSVGASARLEVSSNANLTPDATNPLTTGGWFKVATLATMQLLADKGSACAEYCLQVQTSGYVYFSVAGPSGACTVSTPASSVSTGTWYFVVAEYNQTTKGCSVQLNNGTTYSSTHAAAHSAGTGNFVLGADTAGNYKLSSGQQDEWFVYRRGLDSAERTDLYNAGSGRTYPF